MHRILKKIREQVEAVELLLLAGGIQNMEDYAGLVGKRTAYLDACGIIEQTIKEMEESDEQD